MSNTFPWIAKALSSVISGVISSYLFKKGVSKTVIRKLMEGTSLLGVATCLATIGLVGTNTLSYSFSLSLILLAFFCQGFETSGTAINAIDLAPSYSGFIYGISNTIGALSGIFAVSMTGHLLHAYNSWNIIFLLISSVSLSGFVIFTALGSGKRLTHIDS
jgi:ACS family sodium-dependent inorganic phosphate cotransporter-like MFS transporter 9